jgi:GAF domain-containing protein
VHEGEGQDHEDERKMLELVAQKISRAIELFHLRDSLLKQERLSAIGQMMSTIVHDIRAPVFTVLWI